MLQRGARYGFSIVSSTCRSFSSVFVRSSILDLRMAMAASRDAVDGDGGGEDVGSALGAESVAPRSSTFATAAAFEALGVFSPTKSGSIGTSHE